MWSSLYSFCSMPRDANSIQSSPYKNPCGMNYSEVSCTPCWFSNDSCGVDVSQYTRITLLPWQPVEVYTEQTNCLIIGYFKRWMSCYSSHETRCLIGWLSGLGPSRPLIGLHIACGYTAKNLMRVPCMCACTHWDNSLSDLGRVLPGCVCWRPAGRCLDGKKIQYSWPTLDHSTHSWQNVYCVLTQI